MDRPAAHTSSRFVRDSADRRIFDRVACRLHRAGRDRPSALFNPDSMRVRIVKVPPASVLEGLDLRPYKLRAPETRDLIRPIADVLIAWGYAERVASRDGHTRKGRRTPRKK